MKHNKKITILILLMFLITQFIGLYVVNSYLPQKVIGGKIVNQTSKILPYGLEPIESEEDVNYLWSFFTLFVSFTIAITLLLFLIRIRAKWVLRLWFLLVTTVALGLAINAFLPDHYYSSMIGILIALPFAILKIYKHNPYLHNFTELLIYPGIAAVFVPLLGLESVILLLVLISVYDAWAVWKSKIMQRMAKFQMDELNVFSGFFIPYADKKIRAQIRKLKKKIKEKKITKEEVMKKKIKINVAILGGGDVIFPIITSGVVMKVWGFFPALFVIFGAFFGLAYLLVFSEKKKFYPAMPFISAGIFLGMLLAWIVF